MSRRKAEMVLELIDKVTKPAQKIIKTMQKVASATHQAMAKSIDSLANAQRGLSDGMRRSAASMAAQKGQLHGAAIETGVLATGLVSLLEPAIQAEQRLANISKVVDFNEADGFQKLQAEIRELVTSGGLAMTAEGIAEIISAAGRMGVVDASLPDAQKRKELLEFAATAGKMAVAFEVSADEAGTALARWRQNLSLSQDEAVLLGDTVNLLGNTMATNEADIMRVINRQGVVAKTAGLAANEIAALSATLLASGAAPEIAATGLKNFTNALTRGESATDRQLLVFDALKIDAVEMAKAMQKDAPAAIMQVIRAFEKIEPYRRSSLIGDLFGEEAKGAIAPLIMNAELLETTLGKVNDKTKIAGLMEEEYQRQAATTLVNRRRFLEYLTGIAVVVGNAVLPAFNNLMAQMMPLINKATDWAAAHPEMIELGFKLTAGLIAMKLAFIALQWGVFSTLGPLLYWGALLPRLGARLVALLNPVNTVKKAFWALRIAFMATGIGAIIVGLAMAGTWIHNNWSGLGEFFTAFGDAFIEALGPVAPLADDVLELLGDLWDTITSLLGPLNASAEDWARWGKAVGAEVGEAVRQVVEFGAKVADWAVGLKDVDWAALVSLETLQTAWGAITGWTAEAFAALWSGLVAIDWAGLANAAGFDVAWAAVTGFVGNVAGAIWRQLSPLSWTGLVSVEDLKIAWAAATAYVASVLPTIWSGITSINWPSLVSLQGLKDAWNGITGFLSGVLDLWSNLTSIEWDKQIDLQGLKDAWASLTEWLGTAAADLWEKLPEAPEWSLFGGDEIDDPETLLAASEAAAALEERFPAISAAADIALEKARLVVNSIAGYLTGQDLQTEGARLMQSLADGILSKKEEVRAAAAEIGLAMKSALPGRLSATLELPHRTGGPVLAGARADGGPVARGLSYLVGERGPEIFTPARAGRIVPNHAMRAMRAAAIGAGAVVGLGGGEASAEGERYLRPSQGGGKITINAPLSLTVNGGGAEAEARMQKMLDKHRERILNDIEEADRRARRLEHD